MAVAFATTTFEFSVGATASSYAKARGSNVAAGSLLFCFTVQSSATNVCNSITDTLGNTWLKAFGPIRAGAGDSDDALYGWYAPNSPAGANTITANWSGSGVGGILIGEVTGLAGGGDLDKQSGVASTSSSFLFTIGTTGVLAQAAEAGVMFMDYAGGGPPTAVTGNNWTDGVRPGFFNLSVISYQITSATTSVNCTWDAFANGQAFAAGYMFFKDASGGGGAANQLSWIRA